MTMEIQLILMSLLCVTLVASIDLGPYIRIAQCRSQCLRQYSVDGTCDVLSSSDEYLCREVNYLRFFQSLISFFFPLVINSKIVFNL